MSCCKSVTANESVYQKGMHTLQRSTLADKSDVISVRSMDPQASCLRCLDPHIWNLQIIGFYRMRPTTTALKKRLHYVYMVFMSTVVYMYTIQEIVYAIQVRSDLDKIVDVSFLLLTHVDTFAKHFVLNVRADRLQRLLDLLNGDVFNRHLKAHDQMIKETGVTALKVLRVFTGAAMLTCFLWGVYPLINHLLGKPMPFALWLPWIEDTDVSPVFEYVLVYMTLQKMLLGFGNTTMDSFITAILALLKTQISILRYDLERLPETSAELAKANNEDVEVVLEREFVKCIKHYELVVNASKELPDIFGGVILVQFAVSGWILCMTAYKITDITLASVECASMVVYMFCILLELFLFCYYGNELTVESELLSQSVYSMNWVGLDVKFQKSLVLLMERTKRAIAPNSLSIIPFSLPTFMKILKSSYTFYAVLRETK